jgi:hypothetical protein
MKTTGLRAFVVAAILPTASVWAVSISTVPIGSPGNLADTRYDGSGFGAVGYNYRIGKFERQPLWNVRSSWERVRMD